MQKQSYIHVRRYKIPLLPLRCKYIKFYDIFIKWTQFPHYWPFVWGIHWSPVNSPHKGQSRGALMFCLICTWINGWVNNREAGDLRRNHVHYDVIAMLVAQRRPYGVFVAIWFRINNLYFMCWCFHINCIYRCLKPDACWTKMDLIAQWWNWQSYLWLRGWTLATTAAGLDGKVS